MKKRRGQVDRGGSRSSRVRSVPALERFEDRLLMAVFTVTTAADNPAATANDGSLRGEILASNATTTANSIVFSLPAGLQTITPAAPLPIVTDSVVIDGTTATDFSTTNPKPLIEISGTTLKASTGPGLVAGGPLVQFRDLIVDNWNGDGIDLVGGNDTVAGCYVGVNPTGGVLAANSGVGISVTSSGNKIGDITTNPNVISGNFEGILLRGTGAGGNTIVHNFVGTDATGLLKLGNTFQGMEVDTASNTIGGVSANGPQGLGNLISGNFSGLTVSGPNADNNLIQGNYIGTDRTGLGSIGNTFDGLDLSTVNRTTVGGTVAGSANVISGNGFKGIQLSGTATNTANNSIEGNLIGVALNGVSALGNGDTGILVSNASNNVIGGTTFGGNDHAAGNVIAYNGKTFTSNGVEVMNASGVAILGNSIYNNAGLGIKLIGSNGGIQAPTLTAVETSGNQTRITGKYFGVPNTDYRLQFFSSTSPNPAGFGDGQNYLGDLDITTNNVGNASFSQIINGNAAVGDYVSATATQSPFLSDNTSQFATDVQATQAIVTDLSVTTAVPPIGPLLNQNYTYTLTIKNNGPNDSPSVTLTDTLPTGSTFVSSSGGTVTGGVLTDDLGPLASGATLTVTITVRPTSTSGSFVNTATVSGPELDPALGNNTSTTTKTVVTNADVSVVLTPSATSTPVGSPITYTLMVQNNGPSTANGTTETVTLPADFTNIVVNPDQGSSTIGAGNVVTIDTGILPSNSESTILIMATPTAIGQAVVTASAMSDLVDSNPANNMASATVTVANAADLGVALSASPDPVLVGQELLYTVTVTNNGPSDATQPAIFDRLPSGVTFVAADSTPGLVFANGSVSESLAPLAVGDSATITIAVRPNVSGQISNSVTVGDPGTTAPVEIDPDLTNNQATAITQVSPADVGVTVNNPADPLFIGQSATYQVVVTNNGPATATNVTLTDLVGSGARIVSTSIGQISGSTVTADVGTLGVNQSETVTIVVAPTASGTLVDTATVKSDQLDPDSNNNTSSTSNLVSPVDLTVGVAGSSSSSLVNQPLTYTVTITNNGPATATNVLLNDLLPAGSVLDSASSSQGAVAASTGGRITGNLGSLATGAKATVTIVVTPGVLGTATDTAAATSDDLDTNPADNSASASVGVINLPGSIGVATPLISVPENAGSVTIQLTRTNGTLGTITANYATADYTAIAGVHYVATSGTVTFAAGQTTASITVPVLDDLMVDGGHIFLVSLSSPTGGASIGAQGVAAVVVSNTDRDLVPPDVSGLIAIPNGSSINGFVITFDKPMDPSRAQLVSNYHLFSQPNGKAQAQVPLAAAVYNPINNSVTLIPTAPLPNNRFYHLIVNGSFGLALTDTSGNVLFGSSGPGSNYEAYYGQGTSLVYNDSQNNVVTLKLTGGGTLAVFRAPNGDAEAVNLYGIVPHRSKLSGSVKKLGRSGTGHTTIGTITGFGQFGNVISSLTTPSFYVGSAPVSAASLSVPLQVAAESLPVAGVSLAKKSPRGPLGLTR